MTESKFPMADFRIFAECLNSLGWVWEIERMMEPYSEPADTIEKWRYTGVVKIICKKRDTEFSTKRPSGLPTSSEEVIARLHELRKKGTGK
jgi:hypothetical protein